MANKNDVKKEADDFKNNGRTYIYTSDYRKGLRCYLERRIDNITNNDNLSFEQKVERSEELRILLRVI